MRLAILTPDPSAPYAEVWPPYFDRLARAFSDRGVEMAAAPWSGPTPEADAVLPLLSWGYHLLLDRWLERLEEAGPPLINPASVLRWNTRKTYLLALAAAGAPVVPTLAPDQVDEDALAVAFAEFGTNELVVKPQVSAGAYRTIRVKRAAALPDLPDGPVLIQPFLPAVNGEGELSLFYFGGRFSHAVRKVAADGDFRIQPQFGGRLTRFGPDAEAFAAAEAALAAAPDGLAYARLDLIRAPDGRLALMELEAIEPDLYLDVVPEAAPAFVDAVLAAATASPG